MVSTVVRLEARVKQLESEVRDLKTRLMAVPESPWYRQILGTFANDPVFDEIVPVWPRPAGSLDVIRRGRRRRPVSGGRRVPECLSFLTPTISRCSSVRARKRTIFYGG